MTILPEDEIQKHNTIDHLLRDFLLVLTHAKKTIPIQQNCIFVRKIVHKAKRNHVYYYIPSMEQLSPLKTDKKCVISTTCILKSHYEFPSQKENWTNELKTLIPF